MGAKETNDVVVNDNTDGRVMLQQELELASIVEEQNEQDVTSQIHDDNISDDTAPDLMKMTTSPRGALKIIQSHDQQLFDHVLQDLVAYSSHQNTTRTRDTNLLVLVKKAGVRWAFCVPKPPTSIISNYTMT